MNDESDSRMVRLPVREMRDETKPQCPMCGDMGGPEFWSKCKAVTCEMRAAQEGDLPPLPEPQTLITESDVGYRAYTDYQMREYARLALAAAGGGVPQGDELHWQDVELLTALVNSNRIAPSESSALYRVLDLLASSPQPEAAPAVAQSKDQA